MLVSFTLTMPNVNSWNGKWSGDQDLYCIIKNFSNTKKSKERLESLLGYYTYSFGDGWVAAINVRLVVSGEARKLRTKSKGFCGYEWMCESILNFGCIKSPSQIGGKTNV